MPLDAYNHWKINFPLLRIPNSILPLSFENSQISTNTSGKNKVDGGIKSEENHTHGRGICWKEYYAINVINQ